MIVKYILLISLILLVSFIYLNKREKNILDKTILNYNKYINNFNKLDLKLRGCKNKAICKIKYNNSVKPLNLSEKQKLKDFINLIYNELNGNFKKIFQNIKIFRVQKNLDNNLPHTIQNYIILPYDLTNSIISNKLNLFYFRLIVHEQFHVFQRLNYDLIKILYEKYWNLKLFDIKLPNKYKNIVRANPDAEDLWLFKISQHNYILPLCVYNENPKNISDIKFIFLKYNFQTKELSDKMENLYNNYEYLNFFGNNLTNKYHPHENSASIFEDIVFYKLGKINKKPNYLAFNKMEKFLKDYNLLH